MQEVQYIGENLLPGQIGHAAIILSFVMSILAGVAYFWATQKRETTEYIGWRTIGRSAFLFHGFSVFTVIAIIFYVMIKQEYEYQYVWAHVSEDLPMRYIFSAFWEGQEGSFLLWMFWHAVLGFVLMATAKKWEAPVLSVLAIIQAFIGSMILGLYFGESLKIGVNPLLLLRETMDAPIFSNADYLSMVKGNGLNPLLQNYWMTIHPPTLFLGFASTAIPFAYAIAGLWTKEHRAWLKPVLPWALFSGAILGTGILMGGAWAYEALSFGGYWAWDPVENMSLVPWLVLIAGIHTNLIANSTSHSVRTTYIFYMITFVLILYSTFLTRSGVLGETSVHAFTEMGLEWQLVTFIGFFLLLSVGALAARYKNIPSPKKEEPVASKEFWMFIGTLVLLFSAILITGSTSLPVYNKIMQYFDPTFEGQVITDPVPHYNKYQLWIAVFIGMLSGMTQYLRWREPNFAKNAKKFYLHTAVATVVSVGLTYLTTLWINVVAWQYWLLLFTGIFTVVTNLDYIVSFTRGNLKMAGSAFSHIGFGLMIVGIMASGLNKQYISTNPMVMRGMIEGADEEELRRNIRLIQGKPIFMSGYEVTYVGDTLDGFTRTFEINFKKLNNAGEVMETFDIYPNVLYSKDFSKIAASNPSTKHYLHKDIFSHVSSLPKEDLDQEFAEEVEKNLNYLPYDLKVGETFEIRDTVRLRDMDTFTVRSYRAMVQKIDRQPTHPDYHAEEGDITVGVHLAIESPDSVYVAKPMLALRGQYLYGYPAKIQELNTKVKLSESVFEQVFVPEGDLDYQEFVLKEGEQFSYQGYSFQFAGFNKTPEHQNYVQQEGDIAVSAMVQVSDGQQNFMAQPLYLIRDNQPFNLKEEIPALGLHLRFTSIDPTAETVTLRVAKQENTPTIPLQIATDSARTDFVVLQAIEFPGINFFWVGTIMMMLGFLVAMWRRLGASR